MNFTKIMQRACHIIVEKITVLIIELIIISTLILSIKATITINY